MHISGWSKPDNRLYLGVRCLKCQTPILFALDHSEEGGQPPPAVKLVLTCSQAKCRHQADYSAAIISRFRTPWRYRSSGNYRRNRIPGACWSDRTAGTRGSNGPSGNARTSRSDGTAGTRGSDRGAGTRGSNGSPRASWRHRIARSAGGHGPAGPHRSSRAYRLARSDGAVRSLRDDRSEHHHSFRHGHADCHTQLSVGSHPRADADTHCSLKQCALYLHGRRRADRQWPQ